MRVPYVIATHSQYRNIWLEDQPVQHCSRDGVCTRCAQPNTIDVLCPAVIWHAMGLSRRPKEPLPHRAICASRTGPLAPPKTAELFCSRGPVARNRVAGDVHGAIGEAMFLLVLRDWMIWLELREAATSRGAL